MMIKLRFKQKYKNDLEEHNQINFLEKLMDKSIIYENNSDLIENYFILSGMCKNKSKTINNSKQKDKKDKKDNINNLDVNYPLCLQNEKSFNYSEELVVRSKNKH